MICTQLITATILSLNFGLRGRSRWICLVCAIQESYNGRFAGLVPALPHPSFYSIQSSISLFLLSWDLSKVTGESWTLLSLVVVLVWYPPSTPKVKLTFAGGLAAATSLRQAGHRVTIYERSDFAGEVGASISCAANGTRWLEEWGVNIHIGEPVVLQKLISRDWSTGEPTNIYDLADYKEKWGYVCLLLSNQ
jgi:hypothetical protein